MKKCAIFSCLGLGDGLIALVLSNNLFLNGHDVTTFHPFLNGMQEWFPNLPIRSFPSIEELKEYDRFFFIYEKSEWMQKVLSYCLNERRDDTIVLNPIATTNRDYPFWEEGKFEGDRSFVDNLYLFCQRQLGLKVTTKSNGIKMPWGMEPRRFPKRVVIHPTSSREGKNWAKDKYLHLGKALKLKGYDPLFLLSEQEKLNWNAEGTTFHSLSHLATLVCESGYMIGNDSGIGHLASCMGLPTVTVCRNAKTGQFWKPGWAPGRVITPSLFIPNLKGLRWRDRYWKTWITVPQVLNHFLDLV